MGPIDYDGPLKCYYKSAESNLKPRLQTCGQDEDACFIAFMQHEDGQFYTRQKCVNSTQEAPFFEEWGKWRKTHEENRKGKYPKWGNLGEGKCRDWPLEGTYMCACDYSGCNWDKLSSGYKTVEARILPFFIFLFVIACITCCCCCCCGSSKKKGVVH